MGLVTTANSWLSLATIISESDSDLEILRNANADYNVILSPVLVWDSYKDTFVTVPDRFVTGRQNPSVSQLDNWEVVKDRYEVVQNHDILQRAKLVVDKAGDTASLHSCGVLDNGRKFFVVISMPGTLVSYLDANDIIDSFIVVMTSHDGSIPVCYYNLDVRRRNGTVYRFSSSSCEFSLRKRHTPNESNSATEASEALQMRALWTKELKSIISEFMQPVSDRSFNGIVEKFWSARNANTEKKREYAESVKEAITALYRNSYNSGIFGTTKWAAFNAITEYIDFGRNIDNAEAAQHSLEIDNFSHRLKLNVYEELRKA